jgi:hypothetical protein
MMRGSAKLSPLMLYLLGGLGVVIALFMSINHASFLASAEHAKGEVLNVRTVSHHSGRHHGHSTYLQVRFEDSRGASHTFESQVNGLGQWHLHERVDVAYPAGLPQLAQVGGFGNQWTLPLFLGLGGLVAIGVGWFRAKDESAPRPRSIFRRS